MTLIGAKGGGGGTFKQRPDTLRSNDTFEALMGICAGPIKGPTRGLKSVTVNGTPIEDETGKLNFEGFVAVIADGDPAKFPQIANLRLGAGAAPVGINVSVTNTTGGSTPGPWVTRTVPNVNADFIDLRFIVSQLFRQDSKGVYETDANLHIEMKPSGTTTWINPMLSNPTQQYSESGFTEDVYRLYVPAANYGANGYWQPETNNGYFRIYGKTNSPAVHELRITVPSSGAYSNRSWDVRVRLIERDNLDADPNFEKRTISWESAAAGFNDKYGEHEDWRGVAWLQIYGKATDQINSTPEIALECDTLIVPVPPASVYNPDTRQYTGVLWDGSWTQAFTTDPAWVINGLIVDSLHGLSSVAVGSQLNKWDALEASKWCSQLVPDGDGGLHPRYSLNLAINETLDAKEFVQYLAGAVGGIAWEDTGGEWRIRMDKPENPVDIFTLEAIEGDFVYSNTDVDTRFNDITVVYKNAEFDYREDRVRVVDNAHIAKFGRKPTTIVAIGCTNRQEALRRGMLRLRAATRETRQVSFRTNRRGRLLERLDTILVADTELNVLLDTEFNTRSTGRIVAVAPDRSWIEVRDPLRLELGAAYSIQLARPNPAYAPAATSEPTSADYDKPTIVETIALTNNSSQRGDVYRLYLATPLPADVADNANLSLVADGLPALPKAYRVLDIEEDGEFFTISAIELDTGKWGASDNVTEEATVFIAPNAIVPPPTNLVSYITTFEGERTARQAINLNWDRPASRFLAGFKVDYAVNGGPWISFAERTAINSLEIVDPVPGNYQFRVYSVDRRGALSDPAYNNRNVDEIDPGALVGLDKIDVEDGLIWGGAEPLDMDRLDNRLQEWDEVNGDGKPEDNATVGAPAGTLVGGVPAEQLISQVQRVDTDLEDAKQNISDLFATYGSTASAAASASQSLAAKLAAEEARDASIAAKNISEGASANASTARQQSEAARDIAVQEAGRAFLDAQAAAGSAGTAAGHAQTASSKADQATGAASAASASALLANSKAGEAAGFASAAATSASSAATNASEAGNFASAAQQSSLSASSSLTAAKEAAGAAMPSNFKNGFDYWYFSEGDRTSIGLGQWQGRDYAFSDIPHSSYTMVRSRYPLDVMPGRRVRLTVDFWKNNSDDLPLASATIRFDWTDANGQFQLVDVNPVAAFSRIHVGEFVVPQGVTKLYASHYIFPNAGQGALTTRHSYAWWSLKYEDITSEHNAQLAANASATSASNAAASENIAGQQASAAQQSATNASTFASNASTFANQASTSASNAAGSASTASTQAGLAAQARNDAQSAAGAAANSASAANTSAGLASASQSAAGSSASAAQSAQLQAQAARDTTREINQRLWPRSLSPEGSLAYDGVSHSFGQLEMAPNTPGAWPDAYAWHNFTNDTSFVRYINFIRTQPSVVGRRLRASCWVWHDLDPANDIRFQLYAESGYNPDAAASIYNSAGGSLTNAIPRFVWTKIVGEYVVDSSWLPHHRFALEVYRLSQNPFGCNWYATGLLIEDITSEHQSAQSAAASLSSAQSASASQGAAGASAQAAESSRLAAEAANGSAQGAASVANSRAAAADASASSAQANANLSAQYRDQALGSASAAASSASAASGSATSASGSAASAASSANLSATYRDEAKRAAGTTMPSTFAQGFDYWFFSELPTGNVIGLDQFQGRDYAFANIPRNTYAMLRNRYPLEISAGRRVRITVDAWKNNSDNLPNEFIFSRFTYYDGNGARVAFGFNQQPINGQIIHTNEATVPAGVTKVYCEVYVSPSGFNATEASLTTLHQYVWWSLTLEDVTESLRALAQAEIATSQAASADAQRALAESAASLSAQYRDQAQGHAGTALTQAGIATTQAGIATAQAAAAQSTSALVARMNTSSVNPNPNMLDWPTTEAYPREWVPWNDFSVVPERKLTYLGEPYVRYTTSAGQNVGMVQYGAGRLTGVSPGPYVLEAEVAAVSGPMTGAGILIQWFDANTSYLTQHSISFGNEPDAAEVTTPWWSVGQVKRFRKPIVAPANAYIGYLYVMANWGGFGVEQSAKVFDIMRAAIKPAGVADAGFGDLKASVVTAQGAIASLENTAAFWETVVAASGSNPAVVSLKAGKNGSAVNLAGDRVIIRNSVNGEQVEVARFENGVAQLNNAMIRRLRVAPRSNSQIFLPVMLRPIIRLGSDGQWVQYQNGESFGGVPERIVADQSGLPALPSGQKYDIRPINVTDTGFTAYVKKLVAAEPVTQNTGPGSNVGGTPQWRVEKPTALDAYNGNYQFAVQVVGQLVDSEPAPGGGGFYYYEANGNLYATDTSGNWQIIGSYAEFWGGFNASGTRWVTLSASTSMPIGQVSGAEFGVHPTQGAVNAFDGVIYATQVQSSVEPVSGAISWVISPPVPD